MENNVFTPEQEMRFAVITKLLDQGIKAPLITITAHKIIKYVMSGDYGHY